MDAADMIAWRYRLKLSKREASERLGCSPNSIAAWEKGQPIPRYIALACGAVLYGLPPVGVSL